MSQIVREFDIKSLTDGETGAFIASKALEQTSHRSDREARGKRTGSVRL